MIFEQELEAAITIVQKFADSCPQNAFVKDWEGCEELDNHGHYDGPCSPSRERECWRQYIKEMAIKEEMK